MPGGIHPPMDVIATWPTPNYTHPVTRSKLPLVLACVIGPLSLALLAARLWARVRIQRNAGADDWLMVAAVVPLVAMTVILPIATEMYEFNRHIWDVNPSRYVMQRKIVLLIDTLFCPAAGLIKISILLFYRRLSSSAVSITFYWTTWCSIAFIAIYTVAFTLAPLVACRPFSAFWDQMDLNKLAHGYKFTCFNEGADILAASIVSAVQDFITTIIPTFIYWNLHIPIRQKIALFSIFAIGYGVVAMGSLRAYYTWRCYFANYDTTWTAWQTVVWCLLELHIGAMCANAPALKVFFSHFLQSEDSNKLTPIEPRTKRARPRGPDSLSFMNSLVSSSGLGKKNHTQSQKGPLSSQLSPVSAKIDGVVATYDEIQLLPHLTDSGKPADIDIEKADSNVETP